MTLSNGRVTFAALVLAMAVFAGAGSSEAGESVPAAERMLNSLLAAVQANDHEGFVVNGTAAFKAGLTRPMLEGVSAQLSPRMNKGYNTAYLGQLRQQGLKVYLWKLSFNDGGDDTLAKLVLDKDKVAGFWLQ